jgi:hypothetical protein
MLVCPRYRTCRGRSGTSAAYVLRATSPVMRKVSNGFVLFMEWAAVIYDLDLHLINR